MPKRYPERSIMADTPIAMFRYLYIPRFSKKRLTYLIVFNTICGVRICGKAIGAAPAG